ncbi:MAG: PilZ domain-containing protein [bacterium]|nr:PilZ domain-containing protein [bacterium]
MIAVQNSSERRRFLRLPLEIKVHFKALKEGTLDVKGLKPARVKDLSTGGVLFSSAKKMTANDVLQMRINFIRSGQPVEMAAIARVARCQKAKTGYNVGVEFLQVYSEDLKILENFIDRKAKVVKKQ